MWLCVYAACIKITGTVKTVHSLLLTFEITSWLFSRQSIFVNNIDLDLHFKHPRHELCIFHISPWSMISDPKSPCGMSPFWIASRNSRYFWVHSVQNKSTIFNNHYRGAYKLCLVTSPSRILDVFSVSGLVAACGNGLLLMMPDSDCCLRVECGNLNLFQELHKTHLLRCWSSTQTKLVLFSIWGHVWWTFLSYQHVVETFVSTLTTAASIDCRITFIVKLLHVLCNMIVLLLWVVIRLKTFASGSCFCFCECKSRLLLL